MTSRKIEPTTCLDCGHQWVQTHLPDPCPACAEAAAPDPPPDPDETKAREVLDELKHACNFEPCESVRKPSDCFCLNQVYEALTQARREGWEAALAEVKKGMRDGTITSTWQLKRELEGKP